MTGSVMTGSRMTGSGTQNTGRKSTSRNSPALRMGILLGVTALLFAGVLLRLWSLQILRSDDLEFHAQTSSDTYIYEAVPATRGRILDTQGRVLVDNQVITVVALEARVVRQLSETELEDYLLLLAQQISRYGSPIKVSTLRAAVDNLRYGIGDYIPVAYGVHEDFAIVVGERRLELPGVIFRETSIRSYPYGSLAAHVLGYVGTITPAEVAARENHPKRYIHNDEIGKAGVELSFEEVLRGTPGWQETRISPGGDVAGRRRLLDPVPGLDVQLSIDIDLQALVEKELREGLEATRERPIDTQEQDETDSLDQPSTYPAPAGATVVTDPQTGAVLAMASYPSYDPSQFVLGISQSEFAQLIDPDSYAPFNNRAISGVYSIGSTMKPFTAYAALSTGLVGDRGFWDTYELIDDTGTHVLQDCIGQCEFTNARGEAHGFIDLPVSLTVSSDVYYYQLAEQFAIRPGFDDEQVQQTATEFGFGSPTGVALPSEYSGLLLNAQIKRERHEANPTAFPSALWLVGDTLNVSIGQGDMTATPLQLANGYSVLANGGTLYASNIAKALKDPLNGETVVDYAPRKVREVYLPPEILRPIMEGLEGVVGSASGRNGTAATAFTGFPSNWQVAGKTGTVEVLGKTDTSAFAAFGPTDDPRYTVAVFMEESGFGGRAAAPVARAVLEALATDSTAGAAVATATTATATTTTDAISTLPATLDSTLTQG